VHSHTPGVVGPDPTGSSPGTRRGRGGRGGAEDPSVSRVLPYMVKKAGIGRGCPTLIGRAPRVGGIEEQRICSYNTPRPDCRLHSVFGARDRRIVRPVSLQTWNLYITSLFYPRNVSRKSPSDSSVIVRNRPGISRIAIFNFSSEEKSGNKKKVTSIGCIIVSWCERQSDGCVGWHLECFDVEGRGCNG